ncbi:MAG: SipW-dependent-type signal peptide-containing protein [Lachnospiraceae bacterium]|nr:SipW-dependent-type signal peptide-containing protein [Lachnospiraceae bacterium]MDD3794964.1 SipW-dependent-type signal peptide-containing protein [Lachnospiraceae bacterium]
MKKRTLAAVLGAVICIGIAGAGSSMAYFTDHDTITNEISFTGPDGVAGVLTEPNWKPEQAVLVLPNQSFPKDPQITNTSKSNLPIIVAMQIQFVYGQGYPDNSMVGQPLSKEDMVCVHDVYDIDWNSDDAQKADWVRYDGQDAEDQTQCFYYTGVLKRNFPEAGDTTLPLFTMISVPKDVNNKRYARIQEMKGFDIRIMGSVVQQMTGDTEFGLNSAKDAYEAGVFVF